LLASLPIVVSLSLLYARQGSRNATRHA